VTKTEFASPDIECDGCANAIKKALGKADGVGSVAVDVAAKTVTVEHDNELASVEALLMRLDHAGFPAAVR